MKKSGFFFLFFVISLSVHSQDTEAIEDSTVKSTSLVHKDSRIDILGSKMLEYNEGLAKKTKMVNGYRLMLLNTTDRNLAMNTRTKILKLFPDQNVYTLFLTPYIKLKFGNFTSKDEAEKFKKQIMGMKIVTGNIYLVSELIELKPPPDTTP